METLDLPRKYKTILVPSSSMQLLIEPDAINQAMERLTAHLEPGGALLASFMLLREPGESNEIKWEKEMTRESDGLLFRRIAWSRYYPQTELEDTEDVYQVLEDGLLIAQEKHTRTSATRSYTAAQARALFENAGLENAQVTNEFTWEPVRPDSTMYVAIGIKPSS
jgi:hypothetical protein